MNSLSHLDITNDTWKYHKHDESLIYLELNEHQNILKSPNDRNIADSLPPLNITYSLSHSEITNSMCRVNITNTMNHLNMRIITNSLRTYYVADCVQISANSGCTNTTSHLNVTNCHIFWHINTLDTYTFLCRLRSDLWNHKGSQTQWSSATNYHKKITHLQTTFIHVPLQSGFKSMQLQGSPTQMFI